MTASAPAPRFVVRQGSESIAMPRTLECLGAVDEFACAQDHDTLPHVCRIMTKIAGYEHTSDRCGCCPKRRVVRVGERNRPRTRGHDLEGIPIERGEYAIDLRRRKGKLGTREYLFVFA